MGTENILVSSKEILSLLLKLIFKGAVALLVLVVGWFIVNIIKRIIVRLLKVIQVDTLMEKIELDKILKKGGISYNFSEIVGEIVYWSGILIVFIVAANAIGIQIATSLLNRLILYIPNIISAIFIFVVGILVSVILGNITKTAATNAGLRLANFLGNLVKIIVMLFTIIITLEQLKINARILELTFVIVLASVGLAIAIAFGLGAKDIATEALRKWITKLK